MKTIGLLGGMSWTSTVTYYRAINEAVSARRGGWHSAQVCLYSVDFDPIEQMQHRDEWDKMGQVLAEAAARVEAGGADFLVICTNTMHRVVSDIEARLSIDVLHIADATAAKLTADGVRRVGLLGTRFTMEQDFYRGRLEQKHGIEVLTPPEASREIVHRVIYDELCQDNVRDASRAQFLEIIAGLVDAGAEAVILGCTEIGLLVKSEHTPTPLYDTTLIHVNAAVDRALAEG